MNFNCIICSEIFQPSLEIYATKCGHIFHHVCLIQWLERSKTCPQCRCEVTDKTITRLYFIADGEVDDLGTLQSKVDNMQLQMRLKDKDIENYKEKLCKAETQSVNLKLELRDKQATFESLIHSLREQVSFFKSRGEDVEKLHEEVARLKSKLQTMENVELELIELERKYRHQNMTITHLQTDTNALRKQVDELTKSNTELKNPMGCHRTCEDEKQYYKKKLRELEAKVSNSMLPKISNGTEEEKENSSPMTEYLEEVEDLNTAFSLSINGNNVGLVCLLTPAAPKKVKKSTSDYNNFKVSELDCSYYSLGGHSKDVKFPMPRPIAGIKRHKPASASNSKLCKLIPNKKLFN